MNFPLEIQTGKERKDAAAIAIGAKLGESIKVTRKSLQLEKTSYTDWLLIENVYI